MERTGEVPLFLLPTHERPTQRERGVRREGIAPFARVVLAEEHVAEPEDVAVALGRRGTVHGFLAEDDYKQKGIIRIIKVHTEVVKVDNGLGR